VAEEKRHARATINYCKINYGVGSNGVKAGGEKKINTK